MLMQPQFATTRTSALKALRYRAAAAMLLVLALAGTRAQAQHNSDLGMVYTQERSKFLGSADSDYFYLRGATIDYSASLWHGLGVAGSGTGLAGTNLQTNIDIHHVQALVGPRYTYNFGHNTPTATNRKVGLFMDAKVGYTFATSGLYPVNGIITNSASGLTYQGGAGVNFHIYEKFDLRLIEADYVVTKLPNGSTNQQNTLRFAAGLNFHFGL